jgi:hypothetical protein
VNEPDKQTRPLWLNRWLWACVLVVVAVVYYGSYFRHGINFQDEGGTLVLQTQRLMNGELPFKDVDLGYNVGWFYPLMALFKITGVHFVALRAYFLALSALAAVLGFLTVEKAARHAGMRRSALWIALAVGLLLIATPGMTFKNYNPLAVVANAWCLLGFILAPPDIRKSWRWALGGGIVLGATWLVRIDLGTFFTALWLGVAVLRLPAATQRIRTLATSIAILVSSVGVMHAPVFLDAQQRGFAPDLAASYSAFWRDAARRIGIQLPAPAPSQSLGTIILASPAPAAKKGFSFGGKPRTTWADVQAASEKKYFETLAFFLLQYAPLLSLLPLAVWAAARWFRATVERRDARLPLAALTLVGAALTMFPQYFFWRPDAPHLSEFGPGYWVAAVGAFVLLGSSGNSWHVPSRILAIYLVLHCTLWIARILPDRWCGTIAARDNRETYFEGENGVHIYEQKKTVEWMKEAHRIIRANSTDSDFLVAWPYHPSFNVMTNRLSYERELYMDETRARPGWNERAIQRIEKRKPRIIVISDWAINGTEASRFKNWGAPIYTHMQTHYELLSTFDKKEQFEVWKRKD